MNKPEFWWCIKHGDILWAYTVRKSMHEIMATFELKSDESIVCIRVEEVPKGGADE